MPGTFFPPARVSDPDMHHDTCMAHEPWCMPESLTSGFIWSRWRVNVTGIPGACATRNFTYLVRGQLLQPMTFQHTEAYMHLWAMRRHVSFSYLPSNTHLLPITGYQSLYNTTYIILFNLGPGILRNSHVNFHVRNYLFNKHRFYERDCGLVKPHGDKDRGELRLRERLFAHHVIYWTNIELPTKLSVAFTWEQCHKKCQVSKNLIRSMFSDIKLFELLRIIFCPIT